MFTARLFKIILGATLLTCSFFGSNHAGAQSLPEPRAVCAYCGTPVPNGVHSANCPYHAGSSKSGGARSSGSKAHKSSPDMNAVIAGTIFQGLLTSMFAPPNTKTDTNQQAIIAQQKAAALAARQAAEQERAKQAAFQAERAKMMQSFKQLDGTPGPAFKSLSDSALAYKNLDDDAESLAAQARTPFDSAAEEKQVSPGAAGAGTPFFGDTMPLADIQLLVNPENDPRVVDLKKASTYVIENLKEESETPAKEPQPPEDKTATAPECAKLATKLTGFRNQQAKFQKTVTLAEEQLDAWQNANRNALINAAKDGIDYFTGQLLDGLGKRGKAAERLQRIYEKNAGKMAQEGLNMHDIQARINRLRMLSSAGKISELTSNISDWQTFIKDGMSGLMAQLTSSNLEIEEMLADPAMQKYVETESPELKTLLDISKLAASNAVFGKWVAKKIPIIAGIELSINQSYNAMDWLLSFNRIVQANKINGQVLHAARSLQNKIDAASLALKECP